MSLSWSEGQSYDRTVVIWRVYVFGLAWLTAWGWGIWCYPWHEDIPCEWPQCQRWELRE